MPRNGSDERNFGSGSIRLESAGSRWTFTIFIFFIATGFCWESVRMWIAAEYAASGKPELWRRAARWQPDNAAYWAQLGSMEAWDLELGDLEHAAADYERAVAANPRSDHDSMELAGIYERRGETSQARAAYEKAKTWHPRSAQVAWRYGSFLLRQEEYPLADAEIRRALLANPTLTGAGVLQCWGTGQSATLVLDKVVPPQKQQLLLAMNAFLSEQQVDGALAAWDRLATTGEWVEITASVPLMDDLIRGGRIAEAVRVWRQTLRAAGWPEQGDTENSLVFDGGFEQKLANGGFGWRAFAVEGAAIAIDDEVAHSGRGSLRVTFDGSRNLDFRNLVQYVPVKPLRRYQFSALLQTKGISTDSGLSFEVFDFHRSSALDVTTENLTGTLPWTQVRAEFETGAATKILAIVLRRVPSRKIDNKLAGTVWVDDVRLRERRDPAPDEKRR